MLTQLKRQAPKTTRYAPEAHLQSPYEPSYNIKVNFPQIYPVIDCHITIL